MGCTVEMATTNTGYYDTYHYKKPRWYDGMLHLERVRLSFGDVGIHVCQTAPTFGRFGAAAR